MDALFVRKTAVHMMKSVQALDVTHAPSQFRKDAECRRWRPFAKRFVLKRRIRRKNLSLENFCIDLGIFVHFVKKSPLGLKENFMASALKDAQNGGFSRTYEALQINHLLFNTSKHRGDCNAEALGKCEARIHYRGFAIDNPRRRSTIHRQVLQNNIDNCGRQ
jgi:hypothetical protein